MREAQFKRFLTPPPVALAPGPVAARAAPAVAWSSPARARVLLVVPDPRFRAVASTLLSQRGNSVLHCEWHPDVTEIVMRERVDVVVFDASGSLTATARDAARLAALSPPIGIVAVSEEAQPGLASLSVLPKWGAFEDLCRAIERACVASTGTGAAGFAR